MSNTYAMGLDVFFEFSVDAVSLGFLEVPIMAIVQHFVANDLLAATRPLHELWGPLMVGIYSKHIMIPNIDTTET